MPSPTPIRAALLLTMVALIALVMVAPTGALLSGHSTLSPAASSGPARSSAPLTNTVVASHPASVVTAGSRVYQTHDSSPLGSAQPGLDAVDNVSGTVYSLSVAAPLLVAFNGFTGAQERVLVLANASAGVSAQSIAFDNLSGRLYVGLVATTGSILAVIDAATFTWVTNLSFATSPVPTFVPAQEMYDYHSNQLLVQNSSTQDVMAVNTTTDTFATFIPISCTGVTLSGSCYSYGMFAVLDDFAQWIAVLPDSSSFAWAIYLAPDPVNDTIVGGFNGAGATPAFIFGPGAFWPAFNETYFVNASGNGDVAYFNNSGGLGGVSAAIVPGYPTSMINDPATGWLVLSVENNTGGFGAQVDLINPLSVTLAGYVTNVSLPTYEYVSQVVAFDASNGTGYVVTSGYSPGTQELVTVGFGTPPAVVIQNYPETPVVNGFISEAIDPALGLIVEAPLYSNLVYALSETTGLVVWSTAIPTSTQVLWVTMDSADGIAYVGTYVSIVALAASTGTVDGTFAVGAPAYELSYGFGHLLYAVDDTNDTIQVYSNSGGAGSLLWTKTIQLAAGSSPCTLSASPVSEAAADLTCGIPYNTVQINTVAAGTTVDNVSGSSVGWAAEFNASGALWVGNVSGVGGGGSVDVYAAGTWAHVSTFPTPVPVDFLDFVPALGAVAVTAYRSNSDLIDASTGALIATFHAPGPVEFLATDSGNGAIAVASSTGETLIANLVPLPGAAGGLAVTASNSTLTATWTAATGASGYPVTGYDVYTGASATGPWTQVGSATAALTATLTGLTDGTTYYVTVRATSGSGTGPTATPASGTPSGIPYPPTGLAISSNTTSTLVVGWSAPSSTGGLSISSYSVLYATSASGPWTTASAGTQTTATLTGLSSGTTYFVKVEAANSAGTSNPSASVQGKTSGSAPGTSSGGGLSGGSWLWIAIAVIVVVAVIAVALAMMMRRRNTGPSASGAPPGGPTGPSAPPPGASGGAPPMPPPGAQ